MKIPKQIKIGGHTITVKVVEDLSADGYWSSSRNLIELRAGLPPSQMQETLIHEILHAINNELDHSVLELTAQMLYQVLSDNKLVFDGKDKK